MADRHPAEFYFQLTERRASRSVNIFRDNRSNRGHDLLRSVQFLMNRTGDMMAANAIRIVTERLALIPSSLRWIAWPPSSNVFLFRHVFSIRVDSAAALTTTRQRKLGTFTCYGRAS